MTLPSFRAIFLSSPRAFPPATDARPEGLADAAGPQPLPAHAPGNNGDVKGLSNTITILMIPCLMTWYPLSHVKTAG